MTGRLLIRGFSVAALALALTVPSAAPTSIENSYLPSARSQLPDGWSLRRGIVEGARGTEPVLRWRSESALPITDAALEFRLGDTVLGTPRPARDGRTFTLPLAQPLTGPTRSLRVTLGGIELDARGNPVMPTETGGTATAAAVKAPASSVRPSAVDPGTPGRYETTTAEYSLPGIDVTGLPEEVEVQGVVVRPLRSYGARPLVLFLHGRHSTCYRGGPDGRSSGDWPCPEKWQPIPSYRGYLESQELLASQGYVTVSISANGINGQDYQADDGGALARSELVRHHLRLFQRWNQHADGPLGSALVGGVDLDNVMLVGHSRGGEGVNRAAVDSTADDPWRIDSQVLIGPTAFGRQTAPGVDTVVLLPFCDGDVSDLQGQQYVDLARDISPVTNDPSLRSAVMVMGANHNFFNREWTPGLAAAPAWDDWGSRTGVCGKKTPTRLTSAEQRNVGAVYVAAAASAFLDEEPAALEILDGSRVRPASIGDATTLVTAIGANRTPLLLPRADTSLHSPGDVSVVCRGYRLEAGQATCVPGISPWAQPHFLPMYTAGSAPPPRALRIHWDEPGDKSRVHLPVPVDLRQSTNVDLRVAIDPRIDRAKFAVVIGDGRGHTDRLGVQTLHPLPGSQYLSKTWAQTVRVPLSHRSDVKLRDVRSISVVGLSREGRVVLLDAFGRSAGASDVATAELPRLNVLDKTVQEGDDGARIESIPIEITGEVTGDERFYIELANYGRRHNHGGTIVQLNPGQSRYDFEIPFKADLRDDYTKRYGVTVKALSGIATQDYAGYLTVRDDDPRPTLTIDQADRSAAEGGELRWVLRLSAPSDKGIGLLLLPRPTGDDELTLADLPPRFRRHHGLPNDDRQVPLSSSRLRIWVQFNSGRDTAEVILPIRGDGIDEGTETVRFTESRHRGDALLPSPLTGTVTD